MKITYEIVYFEKIWVIKNIFGIGKFRSYFHIRNRLPNLLIP